jgi:hypothetical protein
MIVPTKFIPKWALTNKKFMVRIKSYGKILKDKKVIFLYEIKFVGEVEV